MSADRDISSAVRSWIREDEHDSADNVLQIVLSRLDSTPQRRPLWPRRAFADIRLFRVGTAAAALAVALLVVVNVGSLIAPGQPHSPTPAVSPSPTPTLVTHTLSNFPVGISFEAPDDWSDCGQGPVEQYICGNVGGQQGVSIGFLIVENVVVDPCNPGAGLLNPPPATVDDLVAAITTLPGFSSSSVREITLDGFAGKEVTVIAPLGGSCDLRTWATAERINGVSAGERNLIRILDVDGTRVVITGAHQQDQNPPDAEARDVAAIEAVMDSVDFQP